MNEYFPSLADVVNSIASRQLPAVDQWHPARCGHSDMRIAADGTWFHRGAPIARPSMVKLFSTILRRENDHYYLVTPVEKLEIIVDDAPFIAVEVASEGTGELRSVAFRLNTDDYVIAGPDNRIRIDHAADGTPRPYVHVRAGLEALIVRSVFYELAELALAEDDVAVGLWSNSMFFPLAA